MERNINVWLPLVHPLLGTWRTTQACALTGNQTSDPLLLRPVFNLLSYTSQGSNCTLCMQFIVYQLYVNTTVLKMKTSSVCGPWVTGAGVPTLPPAPRGRMLKPLVEEEAVVGIRGRVRGDCEALLHLQDWECYQPLPPHPTGGGCVARGRFLEAGVIPSSAPGIFAYIEMTHFNLKADRGSLNESSFCK